MHSDRRRVPLSMARLRGWQEPLPIWHGICSRDKKRLPIADATLMKLHGGKNQVKP